MSFPLMDADCFSMWVTLQVKRTEGTQTNLCSLLTGGLLDSAGTPTQRLEKPAWGPLTVLTPSRPLRIRGLPATGIQTRGTQSVDRGPAVLASGPRAPTSDAPPLSPSPSPRVLRAQGGASWPRILLTLGMAAAKRGCPLWFSIFCFCALPKKEQRLEEGPFVQRDWVKGLSLEMRVGWPAKRPGPQPGQHLWVDLTPPLPWWALSWVRQQVTSEQTQTQGTDLSSTSRENWRGQGGYGEEHSLPGPLSWGAITRLNTENKTELILRGIIFLSCGSGLPSVLQTHTRWGCGPRCDFAGRSWCQEEHPKLGVHVRAHPPAPAGLPGHGVKSSRTEKGHVFSDAPTSGHPTLAALKQL